ncbi:hypothetical protein Pmani_033349 [Petrolisthes manimaculis]|uniref:Uncharacterized protein n=1 Tax=Petrolisthes manimaculis TaxID=1843537 RepID=A0AAE1NPY0_9EUCA|nr:hypothetical protein Pmani_033349 [Petrolisthes manimaculis]
MKVLVLVAALVACVAGDAIPDFVTRGKCAAVKIQDNFDLRKYAGRWYITEMIDIPYLPAKKCTHTFYDYSDTDYGFGCEDGRLWGQQRLPSR